ncbi:MULTISPECIES: acyl-CoA-binding protein [Chitinophagaceae]
MTLRFEQAVKDSKTLTQKPGNDILLELYSLYKQATIGDAPENGDYNMFDFVAKAKHEAWKKQKGLLAEQAEEKYIALVDELKSK